MKNITRKLALIGALLLTAVTANAATLTVKLVNLGTVIPPSSWAMVQNTYVQTFNSYSGLWGAYYNGTYSLQTTANSIDFVFEGVAYDGYAAYYGFWADYIGTLNSALAASGLRYEIIYDGVALAETKVTEIRQWWPHAANLGDYWSWTEGMGYFWVNYYPWVYSWVTSGWLYTVPIQQNALFYWIPDRGWVFSDGNINNLWDAE